MKKLRLKALQLGASEMLTRTQLKNVMGGAGSKAGKCCQTASGDGYGSGNVHCSDCVEGAIRCTIGVLVAC